MKRTLRFLLIILFFFPATLCLVKAQRVEYTYDAAGNRKSKTIVIGSQSLAKAWYSNEENIEPIFDTLSSKEIKIFPNPTSGYLAVEIPDIHEEDAVNIKIFDMHGKIIEDKNTSQLRNEFDLTLQSNGNYIMTISIGKENTTWMIIKK